MSTLKKTISVYSTKNVDVQLPFFSRFGSDFFVVISEEEVWNVSAYSFDRGIKKTRLSTSNALNYEPCTREEFLSAYEETMREISSLPIEQPLFKNQNNGGAE